MDIFIKMIKLYMVDKGRDDFVNYLAEILGCSKQWASAKMTQKTGFTAAEISLLTKELDFDPIQLKTALESGVHGEDDSDRVCKAAE